MVIASSSRSWVKVCHVEAGHQHERRAQNQRRIQNYIQAIDVVERKAAENGVGRVERRAMRAE